MPRLLCLALWLLAASKGPWEEDYRVLSAHRLVMPVLGANPKDIQDTYSDARSGGRVHEAADILAPRNTPLSPWTME